MEHIDRDGYVRRYEERLRQFGYSPETLGWGKGGRQDVRFSVLAEGILRNPASSVLDVGCGFGDLVDFLRARGWHGHYTGVDLVGGLLDIARQRHPNDQFMQLDASAHLMDVERHDYVLSSGALNARLTGGDNRAHIQQLLVAMMDRCTQAVAVDFLSTWVDFTHPDAWHTDPVWALEQARRISRRVILRADYMPFEFALLLFKDDCISERNIFSGFSVTPLPASA